MAHLAAVLSQRLLLYLQHIKKAEVLVIRSDGLQRARLPPSDSWPLICQFITGEFDVCPLLWENTMYIKVEMLQQYL